MELNFPMRRDFFICLLLAGITLGVYWPVSHYGFINYDDHASIRDNPEINSGLNGHSVWWAITGITAQNWQPVTSLTFVLGHQLWGTAPGAEHLENVIFQGANAVLLFLLLKRLTGATWRSALAAALFAWHPLRVESVAWISERKDVLSGFFFLLTLWAYTRYVEEFKVQSSKFKVFFGLSLLFFALGLMSKPMLVTVPLILLLLDFWPWQRVRVENPGFGIQRLVFEKTPFFLLAAAACIVTVFAQQGSGVVVPLAWAPLHYRFINAVISYLDYFLKILWPANLAVMYPLSAHLPRIQFFAATGFLIVVSRWVWGARRTRPYLLVGWLWYLVMLVPVIGLVQVGVQSMADRYTYLPSIGLFLALAWGLGDMAAIANRWRAGATAGAAALLLACLLMTRHQLGYWQDSVSLFRHAIQVTGENALVNYFLGNSFLEAGNPDEAVRNYQYAVRTAPNFALARNNLGMVLLAQGKSEEAEAQFREVLRLAPTDPDAHIYLGDILSARKEFADAEAEYSMASQLKPDSPVILNNLAWLLATCPEARIRDGAQAVQYAERACALTDYQKAIFVGTLAAAYAEAGRFDDALATAEKACTLAEASGEPVLLQKNRELLELYRAHRAYHEAADKIVPAAP
jgi:Flp pilus assembly protein TadD